MKKLIRIILGIFTVILVILMIITTVFVFNKKSGNLTYLGGYTGFINTGTSMLPDINPGDFLLVKKKDSYEKNEIISYATKDNYITTHRIIEKEKDNYITKGDNNSFIDNDKVESKQIYGKLVLIIPQVDKFVNFIWTYKYLIMGIFVLFPGILMIILRGKHVR
ncbi:MAG: signal peptidase I [Firmicutes bacterium]|nr:signal peptidase I [Bacillota bacterium]